MSAATSLTTIDAKVAELISGRAAEPVQAVVAELAQPELDRRKDLISRGLKFLRDASAELSKLKPDLVRIIDDQGNKEESYTPSVWDKKQKLTENISNMDATVGECLSETADNKHFDALEQLLKKLKG